MMNKLKLLMLIGIFSIAFWGCNDDSDPTNDENLVEISISGLDGQTSIVKGTTVTLSIDIDKIELVDLVSVTINDNLMEYFESFPGEFTWNTSELETGEYKIIFSAIHNGIGVGEKEITINLTEPVIGTVTDIDGNVYNTIQIGTQVWMVENLKTTHYRNGDPISPITVTEGWENNTTGGYCNYNNDDSYGETYGKLYNFYAVEDSRGIAPEGWHVPTQEEYKTLLYYLGGANVAGGKMKEAGSEHWASPYTTAENTGTNESGFTALPGGWLTASGDYATQGYMAYFWTSEGYDSGMSGNRYGYARSLGLSTDKFYDAMNYHAYMAMSVRCVKD